MDGYTNNSFRILVYTTPKGQTRTKLVTVDTLGAELRKLRMRGRRNIVCL